MEVISRRSFGGGKPKPPLCCNEKWKNPRTAKKEVVFCEVTKLVSVFLVVHHRFHFSTLGQRFSTCSQNILLVWMPNMHSRESVQGRKLTWPKAKTTYLRPLLGVSRSELRRQQVCLTAEPRVLSVSSPESSIYFRVKLGPSDRREEFFWIAVSLYTETVFLVIVKLLSKEKGSFVYNLIKLLSASRVCVCILKELGVFILWTR